MAVMHSAQNCQRLRNYQIQSTQTAKAANVHVAECTSMPTKSPKVAPVRRRVS